MGFTYTNGQTTRSAGRIAATDALPNAVYDNPAVMTVRQDSSLTDFAAGYASSNGSIKPSYVGIGYCNEYMSDGFTTAYQDGTTWAGWAFEANAYMKRDTAMAVWGRASYNSGVRGDVVWNETSDYGMVYPYCVADTVGGDKDREAYRFMAGAAWHARRWGVGLEIDYSSALEYRDKDPRPKNNSLKARINVGTAFKVDNDNRAGIYVSLSKYSQESDIDYFNPYGKQTLYQMTGLGTIYKRFSTVNDETVYKGRSIGAGLTWATASRRGLSASVGVSRFFVEKILPDLNNTPINSIEQYCVTAEASYGIRYGSVVMRPIVSFDYLDRLGEEIYYDDGSQNYHEIARAKPYHNRLCQLNFGGAVDKRRESKGLSASLMMSVRNLEEQVLLPSREQEITTVSGELLLGGWIKKGRATFSTDVLYRHRGTLSSLIPLTEARQTVFVAEDLFLEEGYNLAVCKVDGVGASLRMDVALRKYMRSAFIRFDWRSDFRSNGCSDGHVRVEDSAHAFAICLGLVVN